MSDAIQREMTVDEFLATADEREGRWEIEHGLAYPSAPERLDHARVKLQTVLALAEAIRRAGLPCEAVTDSVAIRITARTAYQPDALVYCGPRLPADTREVTQPLIVVEVLSPTTEWRDVHRKLIGYFSIPSVVHYLILDPRDSNLVHHKRGGGGIIETRPRHEGRLRLDPPGLEMTVAELFPAA